MVSVIEKLPINFPTDFLPDRRLITDLLAFAIEGRAGTKEEISEITGIPTGKSSGKVEPMIHYASGMGLITAAKENQTWKLEPTTIGALIFSEDTFLSEMQTLWLLHLLLCRRYGLSEPSNGIAVAWFELFTSEQLRRLESFTLEGYQKILAQKVGEFGYVKGLAALVVRSYFTDNCWALAKVFKKQSTDKYQFLKAPVEKEMLPVYSVYLYLLWDDLFSNEKQLSLDEFAEQTCFFKVTNWNETDINIWLNYLSDSGAVQIDRYTGVPILLRLQDTQQVIEGLYSELI